MIAWWSNFITWLFQFWGSLPLTIDWRMTHWILGWLPWQQRAVSLYWKSSLISTNTLLAPAMIFVICGLCNLKGKCILIADFLPYETRLITYLSADCQENKSPRRCFLALSDYMQTSRQNIHKNSQRWPRYINIMPPGKTYTCIYLIHHYKP